MNEPNPQGAGSAGSRGGDLPSMAEGADVERHLGSNIRGRLDACLAELKPISGVDWDSVQTILEGAVEGTEAAQ